MKRTRDCPETVRKGRLEKAEGFLAAADDVYVLDDDRVMADSVVTLYIHAGIAAADVVCCARLGEHAIGEDHAHAVALLTRADRGLARSLQTLLGMKTKAGYSHQGVSETELKRAARAALRLVEAARRA